MKKFVLNFCLVGCEIFVVFVGWVLVFWFFLFEYIFCLIFYVIVMLIILLNVELSVNVFLKIKVSIFGKVWMFNLIILMK